MAQLSYTFDLICVDENGFDAAVEKVPLYVRLFLILAVGMVIYYALFS